MSKQFTIFVKPLALNQLEEHIEFLSIASKPAAIELKKKYAETLDFISHHALSHPPFHQGMRKLNFSRYALFYDVDGTNVFVRKILDMRSEVYNDIVLNRL